MITGHDPEDDLDDKSNVREPGEGEDAWDDPDSNLDDFDDEVPENDPSSPGDQSPIKEPE